MRSLFEVIAESMNGIWWVLYYVKDDSQDSYFIQKIYSKSQLTKNDCTKILKKEYGNFGELVDYMSDELMRKKYKNVDNWARAFHDRTHLDVTIRPLSLEK